MDGKPGSLCDPVMPNTVQTDICGPKASLMRPRGSYKSDISCLEVLSWTEHVKMRQRMKKRRGKNTKAHLSLSRQQEWYAGARAGSGIALGIWLLSSIEVGFKMQIRYRMVRDSCLCCVCVYNGLCECVYNGLRAEWAQAEDTWSLTHCVNITHWLFALP